MAGQLPAEVRDQPGRVVAFGDRDQAQVARRCGQAVVAGHDPEDGEPGALQRAFDLGGVAGRAGPVEARRRPRGPRGANAGHGPRHGRGGPGLPGDVHDEHDGGAGEGGDVRGRREAVRSEPPVVQPHHPLDDGDAGAPGAVQQQRGDAVLADEVGVEVAARPAGGQRVVARVDVVRADLVAADLVPGRAQGGHQAGGDGGLALSGGGSGDHQPRQPHPGLTTQCPAAPSAPRPSDA